MIIIINTKQKITISQQIHQAIISVKIHFSTQQEP